MFKARDVAIQFVAFIVAIKLPIAYGTVVDTFSVGAPEIAISWSERDFGSIIYIILTYSVKFYQVSTLSPVNMAFETKIRLTNRNTCIRIPNSSSEDNLIRRIYRRSRRHNHTSIAREYIWKYWNIEFVEVESESVKMKIISLGIMERY